jgi:hypothetical protein
MFPHTDCVEVVMLFERDDDDQKIVPEDDKEANPPTDGEE